MRTKKNIAMCDILMPRCKQVERVNLALAAH